MSAKKTGGGVANKKSRDKANAARMKKDGVIRTTFRDPITYAIVACGTVPGTKRKLDAWA